MLAMSARAVVEAQDEQEVFDANRHGAQVFGAALPVVRGTFDRAEGSGRQWRNGSRCAATAPGRR